MNANPTHKLKVVDGDTQRPEGAILKHDRFEHRRLLRMAVVEYTSVNGDVGYRIKFERRIRHSTRRNFLKNWKPCEQPANEA